ncbi:MAG: DUF4870 domain-containing protein [Dehalococcoidia bacterium]
MTIDGDRLDCYYSFGDAMQISPEERRRVYEEEKDRIEAERRERVTGGPSSIGLEPNTAGLLCYLGFWITGIIFLIIEQENRFVRFHALQSIVTFGGLAIIGALLSLIPFMGIVFGPIIGVLILVLWILMMVKAHQGELYRLPLAGLVAEGVLPVEWRTGRPGTGQEQGTDAPPVAEQTAQASESGKAESSDSEAAPSSDKRIQKRGLIDDRSGGGRVGRVAGYSVAIVINVILLGFFSFFHRYIAFYYSDSAGGITRVPILTEDYFTFLPILVTALVISIAAHVVLIIYDRYLLREIIQIALAAIGIAVLVNLLAIHPFDFSGIPNPYVVEIMPSVATIIFVVIAVALGIGALVRFVKLMVTVSQ